MALPIIQIIIALMFVGTAHTVLTLGRREKHLPPGGLYSLANMEDDADCPRLTPVGPPTKPVIGNAHLIPRKGAHFT